MYKWILKNKGILILSDYHGLVWPAYVWPAEDIHLFFDIHLYMIWHLVYT